MPGRMPAVLSGIVGAGRRGDVGAPTGVSGDVGAPGGLSAEVGVGAPTGGEEAPGLMPGEGAPGLVLEAVRN